MVTRSHLGGPTRLRGQKARRLATTLLLAGFTMATACGKNADEKTGSGGSGGGEGGQGTIPDTIVMPADCPHETPGELTPCQEEGKVCTYTTGLCTLTFTCYLSASDPEDPFDCFPNGLVWSGADQGDCDGCAGQNGSCVSCGEAQQGDACDVIGATCPGEHGGNCGGERICGSDHTWRETIEPGCCI